MNFCSKPRSKYCGPTNESIYNLLPAIVAKPVKDNLYKSIYKRKVLLESDCGKKGHKTFGQSDLRLRGPENYLKREENRPRVVLQKIVKKKEEKKCKDEKKNKDPCDDLNNASKPMHDISKICPLADKRVPVRNNEIKKYNYDFKPNENFCKEHEQNIIKMNNLLCKTKKTKNFIGINKKKTASFKKSIDRSRSMVVFTRNGEKYLYDRSGFDNKFSTSYQMGKTPAYVKNRKLELEKGVNEFNEKLMKKIEAESMKKLRKEERQDLLECLEASREKLQLKYQALPLLISSLTIKNNRIKLEGKLAQIEKDIRLISAHSQIYVTQ